MEVVPLSATPGQPQHASLSGRNASHENYDGESCFITIVDCTDMHLQDGIIRITVIVTLLQAP